MKRSKGSMVLYFTIVFPVLLIFFGVCFDVVRIKYARSKVSESLYSSLDSVLADYNREVYSEYGIFVLGDVDYTNDFKGFVCSNLEGKHIDIAGSSVQLIKPLSGSGVLKDQILEDMKVKGMVNFSKDFYEILKGFMEVEDMDMEGAIGSGEDYVEGLNGKVKENLEEIKGLEERRKNGEEGLDGRIEELYQENKELLILIEDIADGGSSSSSSSPSSSIGDDTLEKLGKLFKDDFDDMVKHFFDLDYTFHKSRGLADEVGSSGGSSFSDLRDKFLLDEYVLDHFSNVTTGEAEAERIIGVGFPSNGIMEVVLLRTFLDGVGYFFFDEKAPGELLERLVYSGVCGFVSGVDDTLSLTSGADNRVSLINAEGCSTGLEDIKLDYRNHLQLLLLTVADEYILGEVYDKVAGVVGSEGYTGVKGEVSGSVDLWFLSFLPDGFGFLGGSVDGGCFVFKEEDELYFF